MIYSSIGLQIYAALERGSQGRLKDWGGMGFGRPKKPGSNRNFVSVDSSVDGTLK